MKLKFQIRDLLWLMVVVACCALWWRDRMVIHRLEAENAREAAQTRAIMDFMIQSQSALTPPPTPPSATLVLKPESAGEDGAFLAPVEVPVEVLFGDLPTIKLDAINGPYRSYWPLIFDGTDDELQKHLSHSKP